MYDIPEADNYYFITYHLNYKQKAEITESIYNFSFPGH